MIDIVVPTIGRSTLHDLLASLTAARGPLPANLFVVDDRRVRDVPLDLRALGVDLRQRTHIVAGSAAGPAAARNRGWRASRAEWIAFLDDDVTVGPDWLHDLANDLATIPADVAGSQGCITVPLPNDRKPTDWERNVAGLAGARWITADCAYRRAALVAVGGFDERFPRAFREDADLALRVIARGWRIASGTRRSVHPVRAAGPWISVALQAGNADDVLMEALHGADWYERAGSARGAFGRHVVTVGCAIMAIAGTAAWLTATLDFARRRIAPGPRTRTEIVTMLATSVALPFAAVAHRIAGYFRCRKLMADEAARPTLPRAVLFDRDGTLVIDVAYNGDPERVEPMPGAFTALARLRAAGIATGIVSNQSGIALGKLTLADANAVNAQVDALLGPFDTIQMCTHAAGDGCACRKPAPGMILAAAQALGVHTPECIVVGDIGTDIAAAQAAGARAILVPTSVTRMEEIIASPETADSLQAAVDRILARR